MLEDSMSSEILLHSLLFMSL